MARFLCIAVIAACLFGCATLTEDPMTPIALSFSDGSSGNCHFSNKRGDWTAVLPMTISVRKSDDDLKYQCETEDQRKAFGSIPSRMGGKIVASAVFIDFGITDAITDKHREYPTNFVIPIEKAKEVQAASKGELVQQCVDACLKSSSKSADGCFDVCSD